MKNDDGGQRSEKDGTDKNIKKDFCESVLFEFGGQTSISRVCV